MSKYLRSRVRQSIPSQRCKIFSASCATIAVLDLGFKLPWMIRTFCMLNIKQKETACTVTAQAVDFYYLFHIFLRRKTIFRQKEVLQEGLRPHHRQRSHPHHHHRSTSFHRQPEALQTLPGPCLLLSDRAIDSKPQYENSPGLQ